MRSTEIIDQVAALVRPIENVDTMDEHALPRNLQESYRSFLARRDGGYAYDNFIHFFGLNGPPEHRLDSWNQCDLWKKYYNLNESSFVFAEDMFGTQFFFDIRGNRRVVKMLVPDGGRISLSENTFEEFLQNEVLDCRFNGQLRSLACEFFERTGETFRPFTHIGCKIPPSLGGREADISNLHLVNSVVNLRISGQINQQIRGLAPGTKIKKVIVNDEAAEVKLILEK